jgi:hypothetical protein
LTTVWYIFAFHFILFCPMAIQIFAKKPTIPVLATFLWCLPFKHVVIVNNAELLLTWRQTTNNQFLKIARNYLFRTDRSRNFILPWYLFGNKKKTKNKKQTNKQTNKQKQINVKILPEDQKAHRPLIHKPKLIYIYIFIDINYTFMCFILEQTLS